MAKNNHTNTNDTKIPVTRIKRKLSELEIQRIAKKRKEQLTNYIHNHIKLSDISENLFFFTLHFSYDQKTINAAKEKWRRILSTILLKLQGKGWVRNPFPSITIIEHGEHNIFHIHCIMNTCHKTADDLERSLKYIKEHNPWFNLNYFITDETSPKKKGYLHKHNHLLIKPIYNLEGIINYIVKEYYLRNHRINFDNFFPERLLFDKSQINNKYHKPSIHEEMREIKRVKEKLLKNEIKTGK